MASLRTKMSFFLIACFPPWQNPCFTVTFEPVTSYLTARNNSDFISRALLCLNMSIPGYIVMSSSTALAGAGVVANTDQLCLRSVLRNGHAPTNACSNQAWTLAYKACMEAAPCLKLVLIGKISWHLYDTDISTCGGKARPSFVTNFRWNPKISIMQSDWLKNQSDSLWIEGIKLKA